jgi:hypothetical protein
LWFYAGEAESQGITDELGGQRTHRREAFSESLSSHVFAPAKRSGTKKHNDAFANRLRLKIISAEECASRA